MLDRQAMRLTAVREEGLFGEENYPETGSDSEQEVTDTVGVICDYILQYAETDNWHKVEGCCKVTRLCQEQVGTS